MKTGSINSGTGLSKGLLIRALASGQIFKDKCSVSRLSSFRIENKAKKDALMRSLGGYSLLKEEFFKTYPLLPHSLDPLNTRNSKSTCIGTIDRIVY